ncbi:DUF1515 domain-containing protein (plasmid) [Phyllobacterium sp. A18/5-2]|uniref:DUF1515 domain-containing protein n=1 Tax=Phyllobacterium sp. A18/5-2 TaxID=2978392 RepID=UPI0021CA5CFC|nr:DUF1515 domain-containing protein [Phyllobacterium sp. A18/5-2]UXN66260.1 DUF1515 domain-containing protein [Phyllobacterium sp. A18/5-2]
MDKIVGEVGDLKTHIATIIEQVKDSKKVNDEVKKWKLMGIGASLALLDQPELHLALRRQTLSNAAS